MTKITKISCLTQLADTNPDLYVYDDPQPRKCVGNCKKIYVPTNENISTRRPSVYWKQCAKCRAYLKQRNKMCAENKQSYLENKNILV